MAMHLGPSEGDDELLTTINTTPLVDVMLVLLIIFLITIPVVTTSVKVDLPQEVQQPRETKPDNIILSVNAQGQAYLYDAPVRSNTDLIKQLQSFAEKTPQPEVQIRGDAKTDFEAVGRVLYAAQVAGLTKVRFVTDPQGQSAASPQGK
ncbi:MAG: biopolymer transporter ExbD [Burkholderiales bacterium 35-55-47]|jgi:biopolymer transport protein ExbD|uniref:ExbD/TolR family protein n=1 Tax=Limnohabitans sp. TaxID=1907725 RepID=UPI000BCAFFAC|nr:biopolymer transporter ExbD [Limnohabitans sp.]OYY20113.1 MAG: biopolymer transporter ExbD [Burkholderiales bacterium 35-55-47]OYZ74277.1 MAG: biopolymer transporter ExbD [Burkholderiales bacterium 24-55-52]OZB01832.1 MAG: biopolymer transporter ExbD [Burkholderiales bacterium 39-55-53]HQR86349.1 biopolymer transporter ExbD [Limnohabitans sp.]HQS25734.1 biopolymer transporter ExbD [Limnohabitans sp.]